VAGKAPRTRAQTPVEELIAALRADQLRVVLSAAVDNHRDVERHVRLIAARSAGELAQLRAEVDRGLRTRRFLGYLRVTELLEPVQIDQQQRQPHPVAARLGDLRVKLVQEMPVVPRPVSGSVTAWSSLSRKRSLTVLAARAIPIRTAPIAKPTAGAPIRTNCSAVSSPSATSPRILRPAQSS